MSLLHCARKGSVQGTGKRMENESSRPSTSWKRIRRFAIQFQIRASLWDSMEIEGKIGSLGDNGFQSGNGMLEAIII
uniref:Uncharacterized protein n=1 Tax=Brassica campestris TaxID=3711 RepID=M4F2I6_BRACM